MPEGNTEPDALTTLRVGLLAPVHTLDPHGGRDFVSATILEQIFETPFAPAETIDQPARPVLFAEPLRPEAGGEDGRVISAPVREGLRFSDGTPLTAELLAEILSGAGRLAEQTAIEARKGRVVFRLDRPAERFDLTLTHQYCQVALKRGAETLGTGAYRVAADSTPERIRLEPNPHYPSPPRIREILFVAYPPDADGRPQALLDAIDSGEVHFSNVLSREDLAQVRGVRKWLEPGSGTAILYFNTERPGLSDSRVRRALAFAIDRAEVARISYHNPMAFSATGLLPPMMGTWRDGIAHDPKRALALLSQAAEARPGRLSMLLIFGPRPYLPHPRAVADYIVERLATLDVEVSVHQAESMERYFQEAVRGDYDMVLSGWVADTTDPVDFLDAILSPDSIPSPGRRIVFDGNLARWSNPAAGESLGRFRQQPSEENKARLLELMHEEMPLLPLMYGPTIYVYSPRLQSFRPSPLGIPRFAEMSLAESP